jgi:GNAT superfamily N-acetyltransferase
VVDKKLSAANIRHLDTRDFEDVVVLYKELVGKIPVLDGRQGQERFSEIISHPGTVIMGAELDDRIVSIATMHLLPNLTHDGRPYCLVENVVTLRSHRGLGLGRRVMTALMDEAWSVNAYKIMLLTGKNAGAKGFYEKLGFEGEQKFGMMIRRAPMREPSL